MWSHLSTWRTWSAGVLLLLLLAAVPTAGASPDLERPAQEPVTAQEAAAINPVLHYQGRLLEPGSGVPKPDGAYAMIFTLYDAPSGGANLWSETKNVTVSGGLFSTLLGDTNPLALAAFDGNDRWLGVKVGEDLEATPRQRIAHAAYALWAGNADRLDGKDSTEFAATNHTHTGSTIVDGSIGTVDLADQAVTTEKIARAGANTGEVIGYDGTQVTWMAPPGSLLRTTVLNVNCTSLDPFSSTYAKLLDVGTFTKNETRSTVVVVFNGRIAVTTSLSPDANGAIFELRVDNAATTNGRARSVLKRGEVGGDGVPVSMEGVFTGLSAGNHTVSIWVRAAPSGTGSRAMVDPGCWSSDHVVVKEYKQ